MAVKMIVRPNQYHDSITLMRISASIEELAGVESVIVGMGTDLNKESCQRLGLEDPALAAATPNDLIIGVVAQDAEVISHVEAEVEQQLKPKHGGSGSLGDVRFCSLDAAMDSEAGYNLALISTPGTYAAWETEKALNHGLHVFLFSDNVSLEDECRLKELAKEKQLLLMGPDCGTALINGVPLGFANRVRPGSIGVASASGTGLQELMTLIHAMGGGIRAAIGTGGRDLSAQVGGLTMLSALEALGEEDGCRVITLLSKPPAAQVADQLLARASQMKKPCIICFLGDSRHGEEGNLLFCPQIAQAAVQAVRLSGLAPNESVLHGDAPLPDSGIFTPDQRYLRALYCGGTLAGSCALALDKAGVPCHTNLSVGHRLSDCQVSQGNTVLDLGDDQFTQGKPHPMIEPSLRNARLVQEALDPSVRVVLFDVELGYGSHPDPAGVVAKAVAQAQEALKDAGRKVQFVASLIGTEGDPQGLEDQRRRLTGLEVAVFSSNEAAVAFAQKCLLV